MPPASGIRGACPPPPRLFPQSPEFKGASGPPHEHLVLSSGATCMAHLAWWCGLLGSTHGLKDLEDSEVLSDWPQHLVPGDT